MAYVYAHGEGTPESPFEVWTVADLDGIRDHLEAHFVQKADIDLGGIEWVPIAPDNDMFEGSYDGGNFEIQNMTITQPGEYGMSLFSQVSAGVFQNIHLTNVDIDGGNSAAALISWTFGTDSSIYVQNCSSSGTVKGTNGDAAGLIAYFSGVEVTNCHSTCTVIGGEWDNNAGGLIGHLGGNALVERCYATGDVSTYYDAGGFVGITSGNSQIKECYSSGSAEGDGNIGGFVGTNAVSIENCYATGNATCGWGVAGGFVGNASANSVISNSYCIGHVNEEASSVDTGGFAGSNAGTITDSFYDVETSNHDDTGKGEPKTTAEMKNPATYEGWDFEEIWAIDSE